MKILFPDIPFKAATVTSSKNAGSTGFFTATGSREDTFRTTQSTLDYVFLDFALSANESEAASYLAIAKANLLKAQFVNDVILRSTRQPANLPETILGLSMWFDANRGITVNSSSKVSQWNDLGLSARHATQSTEASKPTLKYGSNGINGSRSLLFDADDDALATVSSFTLSQPNTIFIVIRYPTMTAELRHQFNSADNSTAAQEVYVDSANRIFMNAGTVADTGYDVVAGRTYVFTYIFNTTSSSFYVDSVLQASGLSVGALAMKGIAIGSNPGSSTAGANGHICELVVFNSALSSTNRGNMEHYLLDKWVNVPAYKNNSFLSQALVGPNSEDFVTTFNASSSNRYFWLQFGSQSFTNYEFSKAYFGDAIDFGREPTYDYKGSRGETDYRHYRASERFDIDIPGLTASHVSQAMDNLLDLKQVNPVMLYDPSNYWLGGHSLLHAQILEGEIKTINKNHYNLRLLVEELI